MLEDKLGDSAGRLSNKNSGSLNTSIEELLALSEAISCCLCAHLVFS